MGIGDTSSSTIVNSGTIEATGEVDAIGISVSRSSSVDNSGSIIAEAERTSYGIRASSGYQGDIIINNSGTIIADIAILGVTTNSPSTSGSEIITNSGTINGHIDLGLGYDSVANTGTGWLLGAITNVEALTVDAGILTLSFTIPSDITGIAIDVDAGLHSAGILMADIENAGTLSPGNSIGTLTLTGNYTQEAVGSFAAELGDGTSDLLDITGLATLDGSIITTLVGDDYDALVGQSYTVLDADGGITGTFAEEGTYSEGFWTLEVATGADDVTVTITDVNAPLAMEGPLRNSFSGALNAQLGGSPAASDASTETSQEFVDQAPNGSGPDSGISMEADDGIGEPNGGIITAGNFIPVETVDETEVPGVPVVEADTPKVEPDNAPPSETDTGIVVGGSGIVITQPESGVFIEANDDAEVPPGIEGTLEVSDEIAPLIVGDVQAVQTTQITSMSYQNMGNWQEATQPFIDGFDQLAADPVAAADMPTTGSASFEGTTNGELTETAPAGGAEAFVVEGNVLLSADFASGMIDANFTDMQKISTDSGLTQAWVNFQATLSMIDGTSQFSGNASSEDGVWNGSAQGGFFGTGEPVPGTAAGLWQLSSPTGDALGGFIAERK